MFGLEEREVFGLRALKAWQRLTLPHLKMQYHQRDEVSRSSSRWDRVVHSCHNHQAIEARKICKCLGIMIVHGIGLVSARKRLKPIEPLVPVSCTRRRTFTPGLSTWWSSTALIGIPGFEGGFPLRCFQRLSRPYIATLLRRWHDDRYTRGTFNPVLSY